MKYSRLFEPVKIGGVVCKNRFAMAPMGPLGMADCEGGYTQRGIEYYTTRARGGTGLIITGVTSVDEVIEQHTLPNLPSATHNKIHFVRRGLEMTERVHAYGAKILQMLSVGWGRVAIPSHLGDFPSVSASEVPHRWMDRTCRALTVDEIHGIVERFGQAAYNSKRAGFDGIEVHAVHEGYLLDQFAISMFNLRTDEYGGSLENRLRFAREIVEEVKRACGSDFIVSVRYSPKSFIKDWKVGALPGEEFVEMGRDMDEGLEAAKLLEAYGYDALDVDVGSYEGWWWSHPPTYFEKGMYLPYAKAVREVVSIPVICAGRMDNPDLATKAIEDGACDFIGLGRPLLADPEYVNKLACDRMADIRPCLSCQEGCMGRIQQYSVLNCAVNPACGREQDMALTMAVKPKKVLIVGGGVAGCEAARVLALRGHTPVVMEKGGQLGGNLIPGGAPHFKEDDRALARWYAHTLEQLKVDVRLQAAFDGGDLDGYDAVIIATGSTPKLLDLGPKSHAFPADKVLLGEVEVGRQVVIVGGGLVGCETALWLAGQGKTVTIVEEREDLLTVHAPTCSANTDMLKALVQYKGVIVETGARMRSADGKHAVIETPDGEKTVAADTVILAIGYTPANSLYQQVLGRLPETYVLGDAKNVANIMYAIWDAYEVARSI